MTKMNSALLIFLDDVEDIWSSYLRSGPGTLDRDRWRRFHARLQNVRNSFDDQQSPRQQELFSALKDLELLVAKCLLNSEGLCFVTGEAGLIPRRDLHERVEHAIETICKQLM